MTVNQYTDPPAGHPSEVIRMYFMGMELEYEGVGNFSSNFTPKAYHFGDGRLLFDGNDTRKQYHLHDHLGNVVVVFEDKNKDGFIEETDNPNTNEVPHRYHYYSFGMLWDLSDPLTPLYSDDNRYLYNGKEFEQVANLLDYGWRWYDPVVGRWNGVDPLADEFPNLSPFLYAYNNPILMVDIDGLYGDEAEANRQRDFAKDQGLDVGEVYQSGDEWRFAVIDGEYSYHAFDRNYFDPMRVDHSGSESDLTSVGLSLVGLINASMNETINYTARSINPNNPGSVYGSGGRFASNMFIFME